MMNPSGEGSGTSKPGRPIKVAHDRGEGPIQRSLGLVFRYIRRELWGNRSALALDEYFRSDEAAALSKGFVERYRKKKPPSGRRINRYERAELDPAFGTQHRYGVLAETFTGVLHATSRVYSCLSCAAHKRDQRQQHLAEAREVARKLQAFADTAARLTQEAEATDSSLLKALEGEPYEDIEVGLAQARLVIGPLLKAYREG